MSNCRRVPLLPRKHIIADRVRANESCALTQVIVREYGAFRFAAINDASLL